jgi:hypothetical protein
MASLSTKESKMPSVSQAVRAISRACNVPHHVVAGNARKMREAGDLPTTRGNAPEQVNSAHVVGILLPAILGGWAKDAREKARTYGNIQNSSGAVDRTLLSALAGYLETDGHAFRSMTLDLDRPAALIESTMFGPDRPTFRVEAFAATKAEANTILAGTVREVTLSGNTFRTLISELNAADAANKPSRRCTR